MNKLNGNIDEYIRSSPNVLKKFFTYINVIKGLSLNSVHTYYYNLRIFCLYIIKVYYDKTIRIDELDNNEKSKLINQYVNEEFFSKITCDDIQEYLYYIQISHNNCKSSRANRLSTLKSFYKYLNKNNIIQENPVTLIESVKKDKRLPKFLSTDECKTLLEYAYVNSDYRNYAILVLFMNTGLRLDELVNVNINQFASNSIRIFGKGSKERIILVTDRAKSFLERYIETARALIPKGFPVPPQDEDSPVFINNTGYRLQTRTVRNVINEVVEKINKFFELGNCEDNNAFEKGFIDLFNIEADINDIEIDEVMKNFMIEIEESGMLEVFLSKMAENKKNIDELYKTEGTSISEISTRQQLNSKEGINSRCQLACTFISDILVRKNLIEEWEKYGSNGDHICSLIKSVNDPEFTKECIKNYKKYKLNDDNVADLIRTLNDLEYIKGFVKEQIQNKNINGKNIHYIIQLALFTKDMELIENLRKNCDAKIVEELDRYLKIQPTTLPKEMTIGVEIESEGPCNWENIRETIDEAELDWVAKDDGSLQNGTEVASTILTESTASMEIFKICQELRRLRQTTSKRCGGHIHIGADYLTDIQDWRNLRTIWNNAEGIFYAISNAKGEIPRQGVIEYASPISKKDETFSETINLDSEDDLEKYIKLLKEIQGSKYSGINYRNVGSSGKNTIEFRLPNGTINPTTWVENINLFGGLIRTSHELSKIMKKTEEQRTEEEKQMLYNYEILQTETDEKKDAEALIKLCVLPEQVKTYLGRYNVNSKLLKHSPEIYKRLKERISTKKIGQKVFTGKERSKWS